MMKLVVFCFLVAGATAMPDFYTVSLTEIEEEPPPYESNAGEEEDVSPFRSSIGEEEEPAPEPPAPAPPAPAPPAEDPVPETVSNEKCDKGDICYSDKAEFKKFCKSNYNGFVDGGRCFFFIDGRVTWAKASGRCEMKDAYLAHLHTSREFDAVGEYLRANQGGNKPNWLGLKRDSGATGHMALHMSRTYWYDDDSSHHDNLYASNTWIRTHENDDPMVGTNLCFVLWDNYRRIGDNECNNEAFDTLCSLNNVAQTFNLVTEKCLTESPIDRYKGETISGCAYRCAKKGWCRSFNFKDGSNCELFSFVTRDTTKVTSDSKCLHYSYAP